MYIVIDTNIWFSELGLSTARGTALQFYAKRKGAIIALPEVIRLEVEFNLKKALNDACNEIRKNHNKVLSIFGKLKEVVLPSEEEISRRVEELFDNVGAELELLPFTLSSATRALDLVISGEPPNGPKDQQFKDGVVWADCLSLLDKDDVALVTADRGFYHGRDYQKGLAKNLIKEASARKHHLWIYSEINQLLEEIKEEVEIDESRLVWQFVEEEKDSVYRLLDQHGFALVGDPDVKASFYVTEVSDRLYVDFLITFDISDTTGKFRSNGILTLKGDGFYDVSEHNFTELRSMGEELVFEDEEGRQQKKDVVHLAGHVVIGHRTVEHTVRHKVDL